LVGHPRRSSERLLLPTSEALMRNLSKDFGQRSGGFPILGVLLLSLFLAGCQPDNVASKVAPAKPLSPAEEGFLKQVEDLPQADRQAFLAKHRTELMGFSRQNGTFGQRLNADLGIKPAEN